jgi:transcription elongation factor Elf1
MMHANGSTKKSDPYAEYYMSVKTKSELRPRKGNNNIRTSSCPHCNTTGKHIVLEKRSKGSLVECNFCSNTFSAIGNCM